MSYYLTSSRENRKPLVPSTKAVAPPVDPKRKEKASLVFSFSKARVRPTAGMVAEALLEMRYDG